MKIFKKYIFILSLLSALTLGWVGCEGNHVEEAGDEVGETVEEAGDAVEDATD